MNKFHKSVIKGDLIKINSILEEFPECIDEKDLVNGFTAMHFAAEKGYDEIIKFLFKKGVNPLLIDKSGNRADRIALKNGYKKTARLINELQINWIDNMAEMDFDLNDYMNLNDAIEIGYYDNWSEQDIEKYLGLEYLYKFKKRKK
jgi:ankyrin repeat protein